MYSKVTLRKNNVTVEVGNGSIAKSLDYTFLSAARFRRKWIEVQVLS